VPFFFRAEKKLDGTSCKLAPGRGALPAEKGFNFFYIFIVSKNTKK